MKKATKIIKDTDGAVKIPVYLSWGDLATLNALLSRSKYLNEKKLRETLRYREIEIIAHLNKTKN
jgi:hypothetical protein